MSEPNEYRSVTKELEMHSSDAQQERLNVDELQRRRRLWRNLNAPIYKQIAEPLELRYENLQDE